MKNEIDFLDYTPSQVRNLDRRKLKLEDKLSTVDTSKLIQFSSTPKKCTSCEKENKLNTKIKKYLSGALLDPTMSMNIAKMQNSSPIANIQAGGSSPMTGAITSMIGPLANTLGNALDQDKIKPNSLQQDQATGDNLVNIGSGIASSFGPVGQAVGVGLQAGNTLSKAVQGDGTNAVRNIASTLNPVGAATNTIGAIASGRFEEAIPIYGSFVAADRRKKEIEEAKAREAKLAQDKLLQEQRQNVGAETLSLMSRDGSISAQKGTKLKSYKNIDVNTDIEFIPQRYLSTEAEQNRIDENNVLINSANKGFGKTLEDTYQQRLNEAKQGKVDNLIDLGNNIVGFELQGKKYRLGEFKKKTKTEETPKIEQKSSNKNIIVEEKKELKTPEVSQEPITPKVEKPVIIKSKPGPLDKLIQQYNDPSIIKNGKVTESSYLQDIDKYNKEKFDIEESIWKNVNPAIKTTVETALFGIGDAKHGFYTQKTKTDFVDYLEKKLKQFNVLSSKDSIDLQLLKEGQYADIYEVKGQNNKSYGNIKLPKMKKESYRQGSKLNTSNMYRQGISKSLKGFNNIKAGMYQQGAKLENNANDSADKSTIKKQYNELGVLISPEEKTDIETLFTQNPNLVADDNKLKAYQELHRQMGSPKIMLKENIVNPFYEPNTKVIYIPKESKARAISDYLEELLHHNQNIQGQLTSKGILGRRPNINVNSPLYRQEYFDKASKANQAMVNDFDNVMKDLTGKAYNTSNLPLTSQTLNNLKQYRLNKNIAAYYANPAYGHPESVHLQAKGKPFKFELESLENKFKLESDNKKRNKTTISSKN